MIPNPCDKSQIYDEVVKKIKWIILFEASQVPNNV